MREIAAFILMFLTAAIASPALGYDRRDARYVTTSTDPNVLTYIVCLERAVGNAQRKLSIPQALDRAEKACVKEVL